MVFFRIQKGKHIHLQQQSNGILALVASDKCDEEDEEDNVDESGGYTT